MKKQLFFIITAIAQIVIAIIAVFSINEIIQATLVSETKPENIEFIKNYGRLFIYFEQVIVIIINAYILNVAIQNKVLKNKGTITVLMLLNTLMMVSTIGIAISIISILVLLSLKRKNPEDYPDKKEKLEIPKIERQKSTKKEIIWGIILLVIYFFGSEIGYLLPENLPFNGLLIIDVIYNLIMIVLLIYAFNDRLKRDLKLLRKNVKAYFQYCLPKFIVFIVFYMGVTAIISMVTNGKISNNQQILNTLPVWYTMPLAIIIAPFIEEFIFRGVIRRFIKNNILFIIISGVLFGLAHSIIEGNIQQILIMGIPYALMGGYFAYLYAKTDNITISMINHLIWNTFASVLMLLFTGMIVMI